MPFAAPDGGVRRVNHTQTTNEDLDHLLMTVILNINDEIIDARQAVSELTKAGAKHAKASSLHAAVTRWLKMKSYDTLVTTVSITLLDINENARTQ
jgi:hypothetical protein